MANKPRGVKVKATKKRTFFAASLSCVLRGIPTIPDERVLRLWKAELEFANICKHSLPPAHLSGFVSKIWGFLTSVINGWNKCVVF